MRTVRSSPSGPPVEFVTELEAYDPAFASTDGMADLGNGKLTGFFQDVGDLRQIEQLLVVGTTTNFGNQIMILGLPPGTVIDMDKVPLLTSIPGSGLASGVLTIVGTVGGTVGLVVDPTTPPRVLIDLGTVGVPSSGAEFLFQFNVPVVQS